MVPAASNWQITGLFLLALAITGFVMKLTVLLLPATVHPRRPHVFWLLPSPSSHGRLRPARHAGAVWLRTASLIGALLPAYWIYRRLTDYLAPGNLILSYAAAPVLLLVSEVLVALVTLLWLPTGQVLPPIHHRPWRARSVADFWGRRWNLWFSDWFRYAIFQRLRRRPGLALLLVFGVSGLIHEWAINVPLYFTTGRTLFGTMTLYFLLQAAGMWGERHWQGRPRLRRAFAWLVVFAPAPLILNEGLLRILHLWPAAL